MSQTQILPDPRREASLGALDTFASLRDANFRWFFASLFGSFTSVNTEVFIRGWLVFELTHSFAALGSVSLATGLPGVVCSLLGGVLADRAEQKVRVVQAGQVLCAASALAIGLSIRAGTLRLEYLLAAALIQSSVQNVTLPSRQALTNEVVGPGLLMNALALNTSAMNMARLLMPGLAGFAVAQLYAAQGIRAACWVYFAMAALHLGALLAMLQVRVDARSSPPSRRGPVLGELRAGLDYIARDPTLRMLLVTHLFMVTFGMTYYMLLPGFAKAVLGTGPEGLGLLNSAGGVGSVAGSLIVASLPGRRRGFRLIMSALLLGLSIAAFSLSTSYLLSLAILVVVGLGQAGRMSLSNVLVQTYCEDAYRGRVMSVYLMAWNVMSLGIFLVGLLASAIGPQLAVGASAAALVALALGLLCFVPSCRELD